MDTFEIIGAEAKLRERKGSFRTMANSISQLAGNAHAQKVLLQVLGGWQVAAGPVKFERFDPALAKSP